MVARSKFLELAFDDLAIATYVFDLSPEQRVQALDKLDAMMAEWEGNGIVIGYVPAVGDTDLTTIAGTPDWATSAIASNLALRIAPGYGKTPSNGVRGAAKAGLSLAMTKTATIPSNTMTTRTPKGSGNRRWRWPLQSNYYPAPRTLDDA